MSALFGILRFDDEPASSRDVNRMANVLAHHGPDDRRTVVEGPVALGHCLLRVNREDWFEAQPIQDGELTLVADARIDNREALAAKIGIAEATLRDMPDSAVLLAAYRHWGDGFAEHLLGDFTFAIWNARSRVLLLGRDHMGQRGLFYHHGDTALVFATDVQALWAVEGVPRRLSEDALGRRLMMAVDRIPGQSLFEEITILPNATVLRFDDRGTVSSHRYWSPCAGVEHLGRDDAYFLETYRSTVEEAVACRVRRLIKPPALCFSGGFDSGSIAALAGPIVATQGGKLIAISSVLAEGEAFPFANNARAAVEAFRPYPFMDLHYYTRGDDHAFDDIETSFAATHNPIGTQYVRRGMYRIAASTGARLVMDGHGGDYTVNMRSNGMLGRILLRGNVRLFVREFRLRMRKTRHRIHHVVRRDVLPGVLPLWALSVFFKARRGFRPFWWRNGVAPRFARALISRGAVDPARLHRQYQTESRWEAYHQQLLRNTAAGPPAQRILASAHGLEFSRPFHDKRVVELGLAIPERLQFRDGLERYLARQAFADRLPASLLSHTLGNSLEDPDKFRMGKASAQGALVAARTLDRDGRLSYYLDFDMLEQVIAGVDQTRRKDHLDLYNAVLKIAAARFVAWVDRSNG
ncbi:MAG: asparagine synthase-related protein [Candidatus Sphingomonas phytovorans]|nr:asparagine synthase-related protein [Sphingomonas sp.]WEJ99710.1 MAG: asparagine synthase-related protein [Sphingomonas sp.]